MGAKRLQGISLILLGFCLIAGCGEDGGGQPPPVDAEPPCTRGEELCENDCVDRLTDPSHCGTCDNACAAPEGAVARCTEGVCGFVCAAGLEDCNGQEADGCETEVVSNLMHCGGCGMECEAAPNADASCEGSSCRWSCALSDGPERWADCDADLSEGARGTGCEIDLSSNVAHCGACGMACAEGESCEGGVCGVRCGDGLLGMGEECDDGNLATEDGCDDSCESECFGLRFDGAGQRVIFPGEEPLTDGTFTIEAWLRLADGGAGVVAQNRSGVLRVSEMGIGVQVFTATTGIGSRYSAVYDVTLRAGAWVHVAFTSQPGDGVSMPRVQGFLNGVSLGIVTLDRDFQTDGNRSAIGARARRTLSPLDEFEGDIAAVRFSDHVRYTESFRPSPRFEVDADTVGLYRLDEEMGLMISDAAGLAPGDIRGASWAAYEAGVCGPRCGDGVLGYAEECDDGNLEAGDGCDSMCLCEGPCAPATP